jgi:putative ABC transport system ATP-binding protein
LFYLLSGLRRRSQGDVHLDGRAYGGMSDRQRVAAGRAMIHRPRIIFADEPTGLLDQRTGLQVMALLRNYCTEGSLVAVTHNPEILNEAGLVFTVRDGRITDTREPGH